MATNAQGFRLVKISAARGIKTPQNIKTMKHIIAALVGVNAMLALLIFVLSHQLP